MVMCSVKDHSGRHSVDWYARLITPCHCVCLSVCAHTSKCHSSLVVNEGMSVSHWLKDLVSIRNGLLLLPTPSGCTQPSVCVLRWQSLQMFQGVRLFGCVAGQVKEMQRVRETKWGRITDSEIHVLLFRGAPTETWLCPQTLTHQIDQCSKKDDVRTTT